MSPVVTAPLDWKRQRGRDEEARAGTLVQTECRRSRGATGGA